MYSLQSIVFVGSLAVQSLAAPTQQEKRAGILGNVTSDLNGLLGDVSDVTNLEGVISSLESIQPAPSPTSAEQGASRLQSAYAAAKPTSFFQAAAEIIAEGLSSNQLASLAANLNNRPEQRYVANMECGTSAIEQLHGARHGRGL